MRKRLLIACAFAAVFAFGEETDEPSQAGLIPGVSSNVCCSGWLDLRGGTLLAKESEAVAYSPRWGGAASCEVAVDGVRLLSNAVEEGTLSWTPPGVGCHVLTHTAGGETYTARLVVLGVGVVLHTGEISADEDWSADKTHLIDGTLCVASNATLTVARGAVVKFMPGASLEVAAGGTCVAAGVIFTHVNDDFGSSGGDTLGDGNATVPAMGEYAIAGNVVDDAATQYRYLKFAFGVGGAFGATGTLWLEDGPYVAHEVERIGFSPRWGGSASCEVAVDGVRLLSNAVEEGEFEWHPQGEGVHTLTHQSGGETLTVQFMVLNNAFVHDGTIGEDETWRQGKVHVVSRDVTVADGATLTIEPGSVVKFLDGKVLKIAAGGIVIAEGVVFTSIHDDTAGGDTLCDGSATQPEENAYMVAGFVRDDLATEYRYGVQTYSGTLAGEVTWRKEKTYVIDGTLAVATNGVLTIPAGTVVKFTEGSSLAVASGGVCIAEGVIFTHIADDTVGGDTMGDGDETKPEYGKYTVAANVLDSDATEYRYSAPIATSGTLTGNNVWRARQVYHVTSNLTLASGATLDIAPGTVIKFNPGVSLTVNAGATLNAQGTRSSPVVFTSIKDDTHGGDTNGDGEKTYAQAGDWEEIRNSGGTIKFEYVKLRYGGYGEYTNQGDAIIRTTGGTTALYGSTLEQSLFRLLHRSGGTVKAENCVLEDARTGIDGGVKLVNCVISKCNTVAASGEIKNSIVWKCDAYGSASWANCVAYGDAISVPNGVVFANPLFIDSEHGDFRIAANSPCVDAGDGSVAPAKDYYGQTRQNMLSSTGSGVADAGGKYPDVGICEVMPRNMVADVDLAAVSVAVPETAVAGEPVAVTWKIKNFGTADAVGERYDRIEFVSDANAVVASRIVRRMDRIVSGGEIRVSADVDAPNAGGVFFVRVAINGNRDIVEGASYANNVAVSESHIDVGVIDVSDGEAVTGSLASGASVVRRFTSGIGGILRVEAPAGTGVTIRHEGSSGVLSTATVGVGGIAFLSVPDTGKPVEIVLEGGTESGDFAISILSEKMVVANVSPSEIPCDGVAVVRIEGAGFDDNVTASLRKGDETLPVDAHLSGRTLVFFVDCSLLVAGESYDVVLRRGDEAKEIESAISVGSVPGVGKPFARLETPSGVRNGKRYVCAVEYGNDGTADVPAPVLQIAADTGARLYYPDDSTGYSGLQFFGAGSQGSADVIMPGERRRVEFAVVYQGAARLTLKTSWDNKPCPPAWTDGDMYLSDMAAAARRISTRGGDATCFQSVRELAERLNAGEQVSVVYGWWHLPDGAPAVNASLAFTNGEVRVETFTDACGRYEVEVPAAGTWILDAPAETGSVDAIAGGDSKLDIQTMGELCGTIVVDPGADVVSVTARDDETMEVCRAVPRSATEWSFYGLPAGMYAVDVQAGGNWKDAMTMLVDEDAAPESLYATPLATGSIEGTVAGRSAEDAGVPVWIVGVTREWLVSPDETGRYSVSGMTAGYYSVELLTTNFATYTQHEIVEVEAGGTVRCDIAPVDASYEVSAVPVRNLRKARVLLRQTGTPASNDFDAWLAYANSLYTAYTVEAPAAPYNCSHNIAKYRADLRQRENFFAFLVSMEEIQANASLKGLMLPYMQGLQYLGEVSAEELKKLFFEAVSGKINKMKLKAVEKAIIEFCLAIDEFLIDNSAGDAGELLTIKNTADAIGATIRDISTATSIADILVKAAILKQYADQLARRCKKVRIHGNVAKAAKFMNKMDNAFKVIGFLGDFQKNVSEAWEKGKDIADANQRYLAAQERKRDSVGNIKRMTEAFLAKARNFNVYPLCCGGSFKPTYSNACAAASVTLYQSRDPNEIRGPDGIGAARFVRSGEWMDFTIYFENMTNATAAALDVYVTLPKDDGLDWNTFKSLGVSCGDWLDHTLDECYDGVSTCEVSGTNYSIRTEISHSEEAVDWHLRIIDPATADNYPDDPAAGFLPPNDETHRGEGYVRYRVRAREDAVPGSIIKASATIVFDTNAPIETNPSWTNTVAEIANVTLSAGGVETNLELIVGAPYGDALPGAPPKARKGYTFGGWFTGPNGTGRRVTAQSLVQSGDGGLYAHWLAHAYTVRFNASGGRGTMPNQTFEYGEAKALDGVAFTKTGHAFAGWATNGTAAAVYADRAVVSNLTAAAGGTVSLYARWTANRYTVTFDANGGVGGWRRYMAYGSSITPPTVTRAGYTFAGWRPAVAATVPAGNVTYTAQWRASTCQITFNANGGVGAMAAQAYTNGVAQALAPNSFSRPGYAFAGWATSADGDMAYADGQRVTVSAGRTLYAKWTKVVAGAFDATYARAQTAMGVLHGADGAILGTVQVKAAKRDKKKGTVKMSASATLMNGKKASAKAVAVDSEGGTATLAFKAPVGGMALALAADGTFTMEGADGSYVTEADIPQKLPNGTMSFTVGIDALPRLDAGYELLEELVPDELTLSVTGGKKLDAGKAASPKYKKIKDKASGATWYELQGLDDPKKPNLSGLKLTYAPKTGMFKGSFKLYATNEAATKPGKAPKLKKYTVNVTGIFIDEGDGPKGVGQASVKKPAAGPWDVTVE